MGACDFRTIGTGKTVSEAFTMAKDTAAYESGHGGYTGTIAEKDSFVLIPVPSEFAGRPADFVEHLMVEDDDRIRDKWGPAGAIQIAEDRWMFFGYASS